MSAQVSELTVLRARLVRDKLRLQNALRSFSQAARTKVDVRRQIAQRPLLWLAGALALGLGLGARR